FSELLCLDALERKESCGGHFREEFQTEDGEAQRDDAHFRHVATWEYTAQKPIRHQEELTFENIALAQRSYK
ncbi:MAG: fumarate reductase/succinate dehydrogenase flavoprotein subunit, partial [Myxococcaceae bacterium]